MAMDGIIACTPDSHIIDIIRLSAVDQPFGLIAMEKLVSALSSGPRFIRLENLILRGSDFEHRRGTLLTE